MYKKVMLIDVCIFPLFVSSIGWYMVEGGMRKRKNREDWLGGAHGTK